MIESTAILKLTVDDGYIATDLCTLEYVDDDDDTATIDTYSCESESDTLSLTLDHTYRLPSGVTYKLTFWGLDTNYMNPSEDYYPDVTFAIYNSADVFIME